MGGGGKGKGRAPGPKGKGKKSRGQREKGKVTKSELALDLTRDCHTARACARTKRNDFPVGLTPPTSDQLSSHYICIDIFAYIYEFFSINIEAIINARV